MARPFRQQADESILDRAAALFARRGFAKTSVQDVADAVGLSKAGLLHHFPSKDALHEAVVAQAAALGRQVLDELRDMPAGPDRDRYALEILVDVALAHPGVVALLLAPAMQTDAAGAGALQVDAAGAAALQAFGVDPADADPARLVRVVGALSALAVLSLAANQENQTIGWRQHIVATCFDALGHRSGAALPVSDQEI